MAHDDPEMLRLLATRLQPFKVWVHLDKSVSMGEYLASARKMPPNLEFIEERCTVRWGGYSVVQAMRLCALAAMQDLDKRDHVVFLSGRCFPIRPIEELASHLAEAPRKQFARAYTLKDHGIWHKDRYERRHWFDLNLPTRANQGVKRILRNAVKYSSYPLPRKKTALEVVAGSQWMALTSECLSEALEALGTKDYRLFRNSFAPDEMAIQTFIYNSRWIADTQATGPEPLKGTDISSLPNLHYLRPAVSGLVSMRDLEEARTAGAYFIRKVDSRRSADIIRKIDALTNWSGVVGP
ncbi:beta-1,6-N-acetylglucosaminyltransferase [Arthrobacter sp. MAHUQ-56]